MTPDTRQPKKRKLVRDLHHNEEFKTVEFHCSAKNQSIFLKQRTKEQEKLQLHIERVEFITDPSEQICINNNKQKDDETEIN